MPTRGCFPNEQTAGIGDRRHAGIGRDGNVIAGVQPADDLRQAGLTGFTVKRRDRRADLEVIQETTRDAGVLGGDQRDVAQRFDGARGHVVEISDWRRNQIERSQYQLLSSCQILPWSDILIRACTNTIVVALGGAVVRPGGDAMDAETGPARTMSLYRKYRPETFAQDELVGQDHVSRTLRNAIAQGRVSHAYLFCGPRGTGKTSTARLLAKAVNCLDPDPANRPCNKCEACVAINQGRATDIVEIDAASNRGIEDIRDLREQVKYAPTQLRHKFYIIDEAHRLTRDAFNAFLKTLEEPPPNTTFVLATTDPDQLLETVASRCQRFDFHRIPVERMAGRIRDVAEQEDISIDDASVEMIARHATGSMRDALGLLDMLRTAVDTAGEPISEELTREMLGLSHDERTLGLIRALAEQDLAAGLRTINEVVDSGQDVRAYARQVLSALRQLMLCSAGVVPPDVTSEIRGLAAQFELADLVRINRAFSGVDFAIRNGGFPQLPLELAFLASVVGEPDGSDQEEAPVTPRTARRIADRPAPKPAAAPPRESAQAQRSTSPPSQPEHQPEPETVAEPVRSLEPDVSAPAPASGNGVSLDTIFDRWSEIRTEVKARDRKTEALMASCDPGAVDGETLILVAAYQFHAGKLNEERVKAAIEDALEQILGVRLNVRTVLRDEFEPPSPGAPPTASGGTPAAGSGAPSREANGHVGGESAADRQPAESSTNNDNTYQESVMERMKALFNAEEIDAAEVEQLFGRSELGD